MFGWSRGPKPPKPSAGYDASAAQTRVYALVLLAVLIAAILLFVFWYTIILSRDWCAWAIGMGAAAKSRTEASIGLCIQVMNKQIDASAIIAQMLAGTLALIAVALALIVVAKGRVAAKGPGGFEMDLGGDPVAAAAQATAGAAKDKADDIAEAVGGPGGV